MADREIAPVRSVSDADELPPLDHNYKVGDLNEFETRVITIIRDLAGRFGQSQSFEPTVIAILQNVVIDGARQAEGEAAARLVRRLVLAGLGIDRELYRNRSDKDEAASEFFERVWFDCIGRGLLFRNELREFDKCLVKGLENQFAQDRLRLDQILPKKSVEVQQRNYRINAVGAIGRKSLTGMGLLKSAARS